MQRQYNLNDVYFVFCSVICMVVNLPTKSFSNKVSLFPLYYFFCLGFTVTSFKFTVRLNEYAGLTASTKTKHCSNNITYEYH